MTVLFDFIHSVRYIMLDIASPTRYHSIPHIKLFVQVKLQNNLQARLACIQIA